MDIKLYNTLTREAEIFVPIQKDIVLLYTCGPTVYNFPQIGNYRAYIFSDILKRVLMINGYNVNHVMNITDIDDKTIRDSQKNNISLAEFTEFYTQEFFKDRDMLNIIPANTYPRATEYVKEMLEIIDRLLKTNTAYQAEDGSIYFKINTFPEYGKLSHIELNNLETNASGRVKSDEYEKDNVSDFALWKAWDESDGPVKWDPSDILGKKSNIPSGRPGWHIECSAMSMSNLGETIDLHTGGIDNMFPHHENEIAQSESYTSKTFVKYWMHNAWLLVDGKKMSKSAGNFYTLRDLIDRRFNPIAFRYLALVTHYRTPFNFTFDSLIAAQKTLDKLHRFIDSISITGKINTDYKDKFMKSINNDLGVPEALGILWTLVSNKQITDEDKKATILYFDEVFGLGLSSPTIQKEEIIPEEILLLVKERENARNQKNWQLADALRIQIQDKGFDIKDTSNGQEIIKL